MTINEIRLLRGNPDMPFPISVRWNRAWEKLIINNKVALPVENISSHYRKDTDISLLDPYGNDIGVLTFTKKFDRISLNALTEAQFLAFLVEAPTLAYDKFKFDYIVLKSDYYLRYKRNYFNTAPLWGGFNHPRSKFSIAENYQKTVHEINIQKDVSVQGSYFIENSIRAIKQQYAFERFLKSYHLLELNLDYYLIDKIKKLNVKNESILIGKLLNEYAIDEVTRLNNIVIDKCKDVTRLVTVLNTINSYEETAFEIFNKYGKNKSLLKDEATFRTIVLSGDFSQANLNANHVNYNANYNQFIQKLSAYWIYRIRCSIAHNTIGEYIMTQADEEFLVEFGEPLLKEVLLQCFKK